MLRLTKKLLFAIEAVLDIAYNAGALPVQSGEITAAPGHSAPLSRAGAAAAGARRAFWKACAVPRGGYRLARERRRITLGEIVARGAHARWR